MPTSTELHNLQVGPQNPDGKTFGANAADPIGFHGATPVVQVASANQQAIPTANGTLNQSGGAGALIHYTSTQTPSSVAANTVAEQSLTVTGVLATDFVLINKPTSQAGLGVASGRVSAANTVQVTFLNGTAGVLTPTASQAYIVTTIPSQLQLAATLSPAAIAATSTVEQQFAVPGLATGMFVAVNKPTTNAGVAALSARVVSNGTLGITFANMTAAVLTPTAAEAYEVIGFNGLAAAAQMINYGVNVGTLSSVAGTTSAEQTITVAGLLATDISVGVSKPSAQAGLGIGGHRVSAANTLALTLFNNSTVTVTPTASEVYGVTVFRPSPAAPLGLLTSAILTPASVAANTTAEQTFTVTGLVSGAPTHAIPNYNIAQQAGVAIAGVRASATNTLAVNFINTTAGTLTPAAGTFTVAQFNATTPTAGMFVSQLVSPITSIGASLSNAMRSALVTKGLIAGA